MKIGLIGYGAIGREAGATLKRLGESSSLVCVLVREGRRADDFNVAHDVGSLLAASPQIVLECAGHGAVAQFGADILAAGTDLVLTSTGALADPAIARRLTEAAKGGGRLYIAPGAVAGLDGLIAARLAGLKAVTYTSYKPPHAWKGTAAEAAIDLDHVEQEVVFFEGSARDAAMTYPKNANVAVTVGLCGLGLDATRARLVSSRKVSDPLGVIEAEGDFGRFRFDIFARAAPDNPKTSLLTAHSMVQCARLGIGVPVLEFLDARA
jgi:aspartate dehydrogenase